MPNEVSAEIHELEQLRKQIRVWRSSLTIVFGVITAVSLAVMWNAVNGLATPGDTQTRFISAASASLQKDIVPAITELGTNALHQIDFQGEIKKLNGRAPELANASAEQLQLLAKNLPERGQKVLTTELDDFYKSREAKIKADFPNATDAQVTELVTNLTNETHQQVADVTEELFSPHIASMNNIISDLNSIESSEAPNVKGEIPTWQMAFLISDIVRADITKAAAEESADSKTTASATTAPAKKN